MFLSPRQQLRKKKDSATTIDIAMIRMTFWLQGTRRARINLSVRTAVPDEAVWSCSSWTTNR